jgi:hypothetical protein
MLFCSINIFSTKTATAGEGSGAVGFSCAFGLSVLWNGLAIFEHGWSSRFVMRADRLWGYCSACSRSSKYDGINRLTGFAVDIGGDGAR